MRCLVLHTLAVALAVGQSFNKPHDNQTLIVMVAPSFYDETYREDFVDLINFQLDFAKTIHMHENVVMLADKYSMPYLDGRIAEVAARRLPYDALLEAQLFAPNIRDYAPLGFKHFVKFLYRTDDYVDLSAKLIDDSINDFLELNGIRVDKREPELALSGANVVDNGVNKAIVSQSVLALNAGKLPDWALAIKLLNAFKKTAVITHPVKHRDNRLDDLMSFIDEDILAVTTLSEKERATLEAELHTKFRNDVMLVDLPPSGAVREGSCGLYTAALVTNKHVYVPVYGSSPHNWAYGFSTLLDKMALHAIEANTHRKVVPVSVPRAFCKRGLSLRSIAWTVRGRAADVLISVPRRRFALL